MKPKDQQRLEKYLYWAADHFQNLGDIGKVLEKLIGEVISYDDFQFVDDYLFDIYIVEPLMHAPVQNAKDAIYALNEFKKKVNTEAIFQTIQHKHFIIIYISHELMP